MKKKIIITTMLSVMLVITSYAQRDFQLSQGHFSRITFNPAATGQSNGINATLFSRMQWIGVDGAPMNQTLNIHKYVNKAKIGVGLLFSNDQLGCESSQDLKVSVAYHAWFSEKAILSIGLGLGINSRAIDASKMIFEDQSDISLLNDNVRKTSPDFNFGLEFTTPRLVLGTSVTHLAFRSVNTDILRTPAHYYVYGKYSIKAGEKLNIVPLFSLGYNTKIIQPEIGVLASVNNDLFWGGLSFRPNDACVVMAGVTIVKKLKIGYSYDISLGSMKSYNSGSHEIMLSYRFGKDTPLHIASPRFFD